MRDAFQYFLCLCMVEAGVIRLVEKVPDENGEMCVFAPCRDGKTVARVKFSVTRPALSRDQEAALIEVLREILKDKETTIDQEQATHLPVPCQRR